jgi:hypothetical protein
MTHLNSRHEWVWLLAAGLAVAPMTMSGCSKPPPPPPQRKDTYVPPPPPPAQADVVALLQEMNADSRVQFPEDLAPLDVDYARAVISLASSFAEGDEESLRGMLDLGGQQTLDSLVESGAWYDAADAVEAVRIVYLTDPVEDDASEARGDIGSTMSDTLTAETLRDQMLEQIANAEDMSIEDIMGEMGVANPQGLSAADQETMQGMLEDAGNQMAAAMFGPELLAQIAELEKEFPEATTSPEEMINAMYDRGILAAMAEKLGPMMASMSAAMGQFGEALGMDTGGAELRIAIQEPGAAYALSFTAHDMGGKFIFSPAPEANVIRVRASDFSGASKGIGALDNELGSLDFGNLPGSPDGRPSDDNSTEGGGGPAPGRPDVPTGPSSPGG